MNGQLPFLGHKNSPGGLTPHLDSKLQKSQLWNNCKQHFPSSVLHHGAMFIPYYVSFNERLVPLFCWISSILQIEIALAASGEVEDPILKSPALYILLPHVTNISAKWHLMPRAVCMLGRTLSWLLECLYKRGENILAWKRKHMDYRKKWKNPFVTCEVRLHTNWSPLEMQRGFRGMGMRTDQRPVR